MAGAGVARGARRLERSIASSPGCATAYRHGVALGLLLLAGCGEWDAKRSAGLDAGNPGAPDATVGRDGSVDASASDDAAAGAAGGDLVAGATRGTWTGARIGVSISGNGTLPVGALEITGGSGTLVMTGHTLPAFVAGYTSLDGEDVYEVVAASPDTLTILWAYCQSGQLQAVYWEDTRGGSSATTPSDGTAPAAGVCTPKYGSASVKVALPRLAIPVPPLIPDVSIDGAGLLYDGLHPGSLTLPDGDHGFYPFHYVDCSRCTSSGLSGWKEVHALFTTPGASSLSFGIVYLSNPGGQGQLELDYVLTLPSLTTLPSTAFAGGWQPLR